MARFYHALRDDGRYCSKCPNPARLFGLRDPRSGWEGDCSECNVQWYARDFVRTVKACSVHCREIGMGAICKLPGCAQILLLEFLDLSPSRLRRTVILAHRFRLRHLLWLSCPASWYMEATDSEMEEERYVRPVLRTLLETGLVQRSDCYYSVVSQMTGNGLRSEVFRRIRPTFRLLDAISLYLGSAYWGLGTLVTELPPGYYGYCVLECSWEIYAWEGENWLSNKETGEWFYLRRPPPGWRRFRWTDARSNLAYYWWSSGKRWFVEPM